MGVGAKDKTRKKYLTVNKPVNDKDQTQVCSKWGEMHSAKKNKKPLEVFNFYIM